MITPDLTVSTIIEDQGRFLIIEERSSGLTVINQPGGHIEPGETPEQAAERETLEESGCRINITGLLGLYLWANPQSGQDFLRITYTADLLAFDSEQELDDGILSVHWLTLEDIKRRRNDLRTPVVLRSIEDYVSGTRQSDALLANLLPLQMNMEQALANAARVDAA